MPEVLGFLQYRFKHLKGGKKLGLNSTPTWVGNRKVLKRKSPEVLDPRGFSCL
jgi:hypothetical protein